MVFSNLTYEDKVAFFELMDEYFASRPNLFANSGGGSAPQNAAAAAAASQVSSFASKNTALTGNLISSGIQHQAVANPESKWSGVLKNDKVSGALGKMGAAGLASGATTSAPAGAGVNGAAPPPPPSQAAKAPRGTLGGLQSARTFGHVDTSSKLGAMKTMFKDPKAAPATSPSLPSHSTTASAGPRRTNNLPPPPVRRVTASPPVPSVPEPEDEGDLAEAMYEFKSAEDGDLPLRAKQVVVILEKVSADWWKARSRETGQEGLVPSAYLKEI